jgi:hypothetical protein
MLASYDVGDKVNAEDTKVLRDLLARHADASKKIGSGVASFSVRTSGEFGSKCFWVNRTDGTSEDFSFQGCIYG